VTAGTTEPGFAATARATFLRRRLRWLVCCALVGGLVGGGVGWVLNPMFHPSYTAQSQLVLGGASNVTTLPSSPRLGAADPSSVAQVLQSLAVETEASKELKGKVSAADIPDQVTITSGTTPVVTIDATASTAQLAADLANAMPQAYLTLAAKSNEGRASQTQKALQQVLTSQQARLAAVQKQLGDKTAAAYAAAPFFINPADKAAYVHTTLLTDVTYQQLQNQATSLATSINTTQDAIDQSSLGLAVLQSGVDQVITATPATAQASATTLRVLGAGVLVGLLLGAALAWWITERRRAVDPVTAASTLRAPLLGTFGPDRNLRRFPRLVDLSSELATGNELKVLATSLVLGARRQDVGAIVVTSAHAGEGKTVLASNIAVAAEYTGEPVTLVDAGNGARSLTKALNLSDVPGLSEFFDGAPMASAVHLFTYYDDDRTLPVMPIGATGWRQEPGQRLNEARRAAWAAFGDVSKTTAIVDAPALNAHALALQLAQRGALVVVVSPRTTLDDLDMIRTRAEIADVPLLGFVMNGYRSSSRTPRRWPPHQGSGRLAPRLVPEPAQSAVPEHPAMALRDSRRTDTGPAASMG